MKCSAPRAPGAELPSPLDPRVVVLLLTQLGEALESVRLARFQ